MIILLHGHDSSRHPDLFDQMFRLRAAAFAERRKWTVEVNDGMEIDRFDDLDPLYILSISETGKVLASLRLLQTTGPHMLADVFPETVDGLITRHPLIWESTRFCVDTKAVAAFSSKGVNQITGELLAALFEVALSHGLKNIISVYDLYLERILRRAGCIFDRLGEPYPYDGLPTVAGLFEVSEGAVRNIRRQANLEGDTAFPPLEGCALGGRNFTYVAPPSVRSANQ